MFLKQRKGYTLTKYPEDHYTTLMIIIIIIIIIVIVIVIIVTVIIIIIIMTITTNDNDNDTMYMKCLVLKSLAVFYNQQCL